MVEPNVCYDLQQEFNPDYLCKIVYIYCWQCEGRGFVFLGITTIADCSHCKGSHFEPLDDVDKKREYSCNSLYLGYNYSIRPHSLTDKATDF